MRLDEELAHIAEGAAAFAAPGERVAGVLAAEPGGARVYVCAYEGDDGRAWLVLDATGAPVDERAVVRAAVSLAALCELAEDRAGGGDLEQLRAQLATLRITEAPPGIDEAEAAAVALEQAVGAPPRVATTGFLDAVGAATRRLERALGEDAGSPFARAMQEALPTVEELTAAVEANYKRALA